VWTTVLAYANFIFVVRVEAFGKEYKRADNFPKVENPRRSHLPLLGAV
jgi:hypothetical protein